MAHHRFFPLVFLLLSITFPAGARITRIVITSVESPAFEGRLFGAVGAYEKLKGIAYGEIDPRLPQNSLITDIALAPRNQRGMVEYSMDIYILRPIDPARSNHKLFVEIPNRGSKLFGGLDNSGGGNDPSTAADAGEAFLLKMGYTLAWCGWDISATPGHNNLTITVPVARQPDGSSISGPSYEYISFDDDHTTAYKLSYPAVTLDRRQATLTVKAHLDDPANILSPDSWEYADSTTIRLLPDGTAFKRSSIYEFRYTARDPLVAGAGLAATRDFVSFLRYEKTDAAGHPNPLAGAIHWAFSFAVSQSARYINDYQTLGFNCDERGRRVLDGIENWLGGGSGVGINYRFAQTGRTERNRQNHLYPEAIFPFAYPTLTDPHSGRKAGRMARCAATHTCPFVFEINSSNEYWVKAASLLHSDLKGKDLPDPPHARFYLIAGTQHGTGNSRRTGLCLWLQNPNNAEPALRALWMDLDAWVTRDVSPPPSKVPRHTDGTAADAIVRPGSLTGIVPQDVLGWPPLGQVDYSGLITTRYYFDYGPRFDKGIIDQYPLSPANRPAYPCFVSKVDKDGNELAGIRLPPIAAPIATYTGWAIRTSYFGGPDGCESAGQYIPFNLITENTPSDPRRSIEDRYGDNQGYIRAVKAAADQLVHDRFLLKEDAEKYVEQARNTPAIIP